MNRFKNILLAVTGLFLLTQCDPYELPEPAGSNEPVFFVQGQLNAEMIDWQSDGETFLAEGSIRSLGNDVYGFTSTLKDASCEAESCGPYLQITLRGTEQYQESVETKAYPYRFLHMPIPVDIYSIELTPEANTNLISCEWVIDSSETYITNGSEPLTLERDQNDPSSIHVQLTSTHVGGCITQIEDFVYLPHHGCSAQITTKQLGGLSHQLFEAMAEGSTAFSYAWSFESGPTASSQEVNYQFNSVPADGIETVLLAVDGNGCRAQNVRNQVVDSSAACNINFSYEVETTIFTPPFTPGQDLGTVEIVYADEMGNLFRSEIVEQPDWTSYKIIDIQNDYVDPLTGQMFSYSIAEIEFSVRLENAVAGNKEFRNCKAVLPIR